MSIGLLGPLLGNSGSSQPVAPERVAADVLRVIDGRTIVVDAGDGEQTVRLIGVELRPFGDPFYGFTQEVIQSWIDGKQVLLEADERDGDEQGRSMRYVFLEDIMINAALILNGLARVETEHPNVRYDGYLTEMERQARESGVGIWDSEFGSNTEATDTQTAIEDPTTQTAVAS
ncbi:MAG: thermonuclease family protein [Chloroflexi bacterium]|nr:thermonuclease family protein [Chloroflexota bacterium]